MKVFQSLHTPGALVRVPSGRHAMVMSFDSHTNQVTVEFADSLPEEQFHITSLRAGNNDSEIAIRGKATAMFPKVFPLELGEPGMARRVRTAQWGDMVGASRRSLLG